ncbi:MAG: rod shape-determining protein [Planctomycetes bacterium]|nr:rod shape-determining protein [Planctomycetota bacterium]
MLKPFEWFLGKFSTDMGIDLGTANTLVCVRDRGIVLNEPSVVAVRKGTNEVLLEGRAVGLAAKEMLGKTPGGIEAIRPLRNGVIADFEITEKMLRYFITKVHEGRQWATPQVVISIPSGITAVERRAVINSAERAGARRVFLIEEPMAAGIGVGLPVTAARGSMIVDIGGGTTEVAVLSLAGMVKSTSLRVAGDEMDESVIAHCRKHHNLDIGEQTAEKIKLSIGSAFPLEEELAVEVKGRDTITGMPRKIELTSEEVREALMIPVRQIINAIRSTLAATPPEIAADLVDQGITLAGGGALLRGIARAIEVETQLPARVAEDPLTAVARGTLRFLENIEDFSKVLQSGDDR